MGAALPISWEQDLEESENSKSFQVIMEVLRSWKEINHSIKRADFNISNT